MIKAAQFQQTIKLINETSEFFETSSRMQEKTNKVEPWRMHSQYSGWRSRTVPFGAIVPNWCKSNQSKIWRFILNWSKLGWGTQACRRHQSEANITDTYPIAGWSARRYSCHRILTMFSDINRSSRISRKYSTFFVVASCCRLWDFISCVRTWIPWRRSWIHCSGSQGTVRISIVILTTCCCIDGIWYDWLLYWFPPKGSSPWSVRVYAEARKSSELFTRSIIVISRLAFSTAVAITPVVKLISLCLGTNWTVSWELPFIMRSIEGIWAACISL